MAFYPNAQGVFLLGQLILDYTNVENPANNGDNASIRKQGNVDNLSFDNNNNAFAGDGPARTLNPNAEEFYPTVESMGGQFEVRVLLNTPLTTHLQFPHGAPIQPTEYPSTAEIVELPYYGYPRPTGPLPPNNPGDLINHSAATAENNTGSSGVPSPHPHPVSANYGPRPQNWIPTITLVPNGGGPQIIGCPQVAYNHPHPPPMYHHHEEEDCGEEVDEGGQVAKPEKDVT